MGRLDGKVALVTGASANNGGTAAHFMAREGAKIVANDLVPAAAKETVDFLVSRGYDAIAIPGDGTDEKTVEAIVAQAVEHYGKIDVVLNMVGRQYRWAVWDVNLHDWNRVINGYLTGGMLITKHAARVMIEQGIKGSIIHICSDAAHQGEAGNSGYSAAKAGLLNFSRAAAMDLSYYGIRVNTISPTIIGHGRTDPTRLQQTRTRFTIMMDDWVRGIPLGRMCSSADVANAVVFLASDESSFITAHDIPLDGGAMRKYWPWQPGLVTGVTAEEYVSSHKRMRYGEEVF